MRSINKIIVHCTATPEGREVAVQEIEQWHREKGYDCIGYHYVIGLDGTICVGRPESEIGAHCKGHNMYSIAVCYVGGLDKKGKPKDTRTEQQKSALLKLLKDLKERYPKANIYGHRNFAAKECPCFDAPAEYSLL